MYFIIAVRYDRTYFKLEKNIVNNSTNVNLDDNIEAILLGKGILSKAILEEERLSPTRNEFYNTISVVLMQLLVREQMHETL